MNRMRLAPILLAVGVGAAWAVPLPQLQPGPGPAAVAESPGASDEPKTLKERLSDKGSDEQRVDNCTVPPQRRGTTPRPDCADPPNARPRLTQPR